MTNDGITAQAIVIVNQYNKQLIQDEVLVRCVIAGNSPLKLYPDRKIVTVLPTIPLRNPCMPSALVEGYILSHFSRSIDEYVWTHFRRSQIRETFVSLTVKPTHKQVIDKSVPPLSLGQRYTMNHYKLQSAKLRTSIEMRTISRLHTNQTMVVIDYQNRVLCCKTS